jgi:DNA polymerase III delta subunit
MDVLAGESEKISSYLLAHGETRATCEVLHHVASVYTESDAFGLSDAILSGDGAAAFRVLRDMKFRRVEPTVILAQVARVYADLLTVALLRREGEGKDAIAKRMKMHEYKVGIYLRAAEKRTPEALMRLLDLCRTADVASKSGGATGYDAVERLVATMLGRG